MPSRPDQGHSRDRWWQMKGRGEGEQATRSVHLPSQPQPGPGALCADAPGGVDPTSHGGHACGSGSSVSSAAEALPLGCMKGMCWHRSLAREAGNREVLREPGLRPGWDPYHNLNRLLCVSVD